MSGGVGAGGVRDSGGGVRHGALRPVRRRRRHRHRRTSLACSCFSLVSLKQTLSSMARAGRCDAVVAFGTVVSLWLVLRVLGFGALASAAGPSLLPMHVPGKVPAAAGGAAGRCAVSCQRTRDRGSAAARDTFLLRQQAAALNPKISTLTTLTPSSRCAAPQRTTTPSRAALLHVKSSRDYRHCCHWKADLIHLDRCAARRRTTMRLRAAPRAACWTSAAPPACPPFSAC